jgi:hypothetical protein
MRDVFQNWEYLLVGRYCILYSHTYSHAYSRSVLFCKAMEYSSLDYRNVIAEAEEFLVFTTECNA